MIIKHKKGGMIRRLNSYMVVPIPVKESMYYQQFLEIDTHPQGFSKSFLDSLCRLDRHASDNGWTTFLRRLMKECTVDLDAQCTYVTLHQILSSQDVTEAHIIHNDASLDSTEYDGDDTLIQEAWTYVQDCIQWRECIDLYRFIRTNLYVISVPHPLDEFAKKSLFSLDEDSVKKMVDGCCNTHSWIPRNETKTNLHENRLRISQLILDYVAKQPQWIVGVVLREPGPEMPNLAPFQGACLPPTVLELQSTAPSGDIRCAVLANFDLNENDPITIPHTEHSRRITSKSCRCLKCQSESEINDDKLLVDFQAEADYAKIHQVQLLAAFYFGQGEYSRAKAMYVRCNEVCHSMLNGENDDLVKSRDYLRQAADAWHAIGAIELSQLHFLQAQLHWSKGNTKYNDVCSGLASQLEKISAYRYLANHDVSGNASACEDAQLSFESHDSMHVTRNFVPPSTCKMLIQHALDYTEKHGGWTTSRHYAVPTIDIPIHQVPTLLDWFTSWMDDKVQPLLHRQFGTDPVRQRYYVHDAFLVQYAHDGGSRMQNNALRSKDNKSDSDKKVSNFLPLHYDESTHSFVLALNDAFSGGGTYFHDINKVVTPKAGSMVSFPGNKMLHGGRPVTNGTRYIIATFLYLDDRSVVEAPNEVSRKRTMTELLDSTKKQVSGESFSFGFF